MPFAVVLCTAILVVFVIGVGGVVDVGSAAGGSVLTPTSDDGDTANSTNDTPDGVGVSYEEVVDIEPVPDADKTRATFGPDALVRNVTFDDGSAEGSVRLATLDGLPPETGDVPGTLVDVHQITVPEDLENGSATIAFEADAATVDAEPGDLRIFRYDGGEWHRVDRVVESADGATARLVADVDGFSYFAVSAASEPEAVIDAPETGTIGSELDLSASGSSVEHGEIVAYEWSVDGEMLDGENVTALADRTGTLPIELTVTTRAGLTDTATTDVTVAERNDTEVSGNADPGPRMHDTDDGSEADDDGDGSPGFGSLLALLAVGTAVLALRRRP